MVRPEIVDNIVWQKQNRLAFSKEFPMGFSDDLRPPMLATAGHHPAGLILILVSMCLGHLASAQPAIGGMWVPAAELAVDWDSHNLGMTPDGRAAYGSFDRTRHDPVLFCMPYGTPRNTLKTTDYPLQILQRPEQITMIFDGRGDVRRIYTDGRSHPADPVANWMGHSVGSWRGESLRVDTVAMTSQSRLDVSGLPHSEEMRIREIWRLVERGGETLLHVAMTIEDPQTYVDTLQAERYFRQAPGARMSEASGYCQMDEWRRYLERHSKALSLELRDADQDQENGP
jgi:hypothetical protein